MAKTQKSSTNEDEVSQKVLKYLNASTSRKRQSKEGKDRTKDDKNDKKNEKKGKHPKNQENKGPKLDVTPTELKWEFEEGQQPLKVTNNTDKRFAIKVRCTDTDIYTVAPVTDFVAAGKVLNIAVVREKGPLKKDKLVLCSVPVSDEETDASAVFKKNITPNLNVITMDKHVFT